MDLSKPEEFQKMVDYAKIDYECTDILLML